MSSHARHRRNSDGCGCAVCGTAESKVRGASAARTRRSLFGKGRKSKTPESCTAKTGSPEPEVTSLVLGPLVISDPPQPNRARRKSNPWNSEPSSATEVTPAAPTANARRHSIPQITIGDKAPGRMAAGPAPTVDQASLTLARSYTKLGAAHFADGNLDLTIQAYTNALKIQAAVHGASAHLDLAETYSHLGLAHYTAGNYPLAIKMYGEALEIKLDALGPNHPDVASSFGNMSLIYVNQGDYSTAIEFCDKSLQIQLQIYGPLHPHCAKSLNNLGNIYALMGQYENAVNQLDRALRVRLKLYGECHIDTANSYNNLGLAYKSLKDTRKAMLYYEKTLRIMVKLLGSNHPEMHTLYRNLGSVHAALGNNKMAVHFFEKSLAITQPRFGLEDKVVVATTRALHRAQQGLWVQLARDNVRVKTVAEAESPDEPNWTAQRLHPHEVDSVV